MKTITLLLSLLLTTPAVTADIPVWEYTTKTDARGYIVESAVVHDDDLYIVFMCTRSADLPRGGSQGHDFRAMFITDQHIGRKGIPVEVKYLFQDEEFASGNYDNWKAYDKGVYVEEFEAMSMAMMFMPLDEKMKTERIFLFRFHANADEPIDTAITIPGAKKGAPISKVFAACWGPNE